MRVGASVAPRAARAIAIAIIVAGGFRLMPIVMFGPAEMRRRVPGATDFGDGWRRHGEREQQRHKQRNRTPDQGKYDTHLNGL